MAQKERIRIAICGFGEIATKAHVPAIQRASENFLLVAIIDPAGRQAGLDKLDSFTLSEKDVSVYESLSDCLRDMNGKLDAVAICTPSSVTLDLAAEALQAGKHVLVEKPPGDWRRLAGLELVARKQQVSFFTAYHTAACVGLPNAKDWLQTHSLEKVHVTWKESVQKWHPGQVWVTRKNPASVCEGVLDCVFNPLSLLFALLGPMQFQSSQLVVPSNWETPISGYFSLSATTNDNQQVPVTGEFAWDYVPHDAGGLEEIWTIDFSSPSSTLSLKEGGCQIYVDGQRVTNRPTAAYPLEPEYQNLYEHFSNLVANQASAVDDATPRLLQEIQDKASRSACPAYNI